MLNKDMNWKEIELDEVGDIVTGKTPSTGDIDNFGRIYPFITPKDMTGQKYIFETERYLSEKGMKAVKNCLINKNAVCVSCIGSDMGKVVMATKPSVTNQQLNSIKVNNKYNPDFIYYSLYQISKDLRNAAFHSTALPILNKTQFSKFRIMEPPLPEQRAIAEILSSIDDKIKLNNQMNRTLEATAQAIFKQWFVDFEFPFDFAQGKLFDFAREDKPVTQTSAPRLVSLSNHSQRSDTKKKSSDTQRSLSGVEMSEFMAGYKSSGGKMIDSELGPIPEGWRIKTLYEFGEYINGLAFKTDDFCEPIEGLAIIKIAELKNGIQSSTQFTKRVVDEKYYLYDKDILFSWSGSPNTSIDIFIWSLNKAILNQHIFKVVPNSSDEYSFLFLLLKYFKPIFIQIASQKQTTGLGHVTITDLKRLKFVYPNEELIKFFNESVNNILSKIFYNNKEIQTLSTLRDSLLPKLMSGELRVPEEIVAGFTK